MANVPLISAGPGAAATRRRIDMPLPRRCWRRIVFGAAALAPLSAAACTLRHSDLARDVREQVFGPEFLSNALAVLAPLPVLIAGVYLAGRGSRSEYRRR